MTRSLLDEKESDKPVGRDVGTEEGVGDMGTDVRRWKRVPGKRYSLRREDIVLEREK